MTISATTNRVTYTGNGSTTAFAFAYPFHSQADLVVIETVIATGAQTTKALTTDYTVSGTTDALGHYPSGGTVNAVVAPASTVTWTIYRDPSAVQSMDLVQNDDLPAESVEAQFDYLTMLVQRVRDLISRSLRQSEGDSANIDSLPAKVDRASKFLAFDADGNPVASAGGFSTPAVTAFATTLLDDTTAAEARATLGVLGGYRVIGCDCKNNAGTPNTKFDLDADVIVLSNSSMDVVVKFNPGAAITNDIGTYGANGRDQAGAFSAGSWVHFYWVLNGTTLETKSSANAPPTGPTLPGGYTHWAYAGAVYFNGSSQLLRTRIKGSTAMYDGQQSALSGGSAVVETSVSLTSLVPPNALRVLIGLTYQLTTGAGGSAASQAIVRVVSGTNYVQSNVSVPVASQTVYNDIATVVPNVSQNLYYINGTTETNAANIASRAASIGVMGYVLPNGGE